jgi:hypothetical protein
MNITLQVNAFPITVMFGMCSIFLFMAAILQRRLMVVADLHKLSTSMFSFFLICSSRDENCIILSGRHINSVSLMANWYCRSTRDDWGRRTTKSLKGQENRDAILLSLLHLAAE